MSRHGRFAVIAALLGLLRAAALFSGEPAAGGPVIRILNDKSGRPNAFEAVGLAEDELARFAKLDDAHDRFSQLFALYVVEKANDVELPAMAGSYSIDGSSLRFTPRFSLRPGMHYRAVLKLDELAVVGSSGKTVTNELTIPEAAPGKPTEVVRIYPSASELPENQLRFYIYFSGPMGRGEAYTRLRLLDARGTAIEGPFLEIGDELWDAGGRRLTIFIEPGRIKQGLKPREDLGPVLEAGQTYTLHVDRTWRDASGQPLHGDFKKRFRTGPAVSGEIVPAEWKINPPAAGSADALTIRFPRPLDHALVSRTILVANAKGNSVRGEVTIDDEERLWKFIPQDHWSAGKFQLAVDTTLEDLAGNRIGQPFEVEQPDSALRTERPQTVWIPFEVLSATGR